MQNTIVHIGEKEFVIKEEWKISVFTTWVVGLLAHAYNFFNFLETNDGYNNIKYNGYGVAFSSGRWFRAYAGRISSDYDLPWLNGAVALCYISIAMILLIELFNIKSKKLIALNAAIFVTFPTVTSSMGQSYMSDDFMGAFLLSVAAIYCCNKVRKVGWLAGGVALCFSLGLYQAYISTSIVLILLIIITQLMFEGYTLKRAFLEDIKYGVCLITGFVLYKGVQYGFVLLGKSPLSADRNAIGVMSYSQYIDAAVTAFRELCNQLGIAFSYLKKPYCLANLGVLLLLAVLTVYHIGKNQVFKRKSALAGLFLAIAALPFGMCIVKFVTVSYSLFHNLMLMSECFLYLLLIIFLKYLKEQRFIEKIIRAGAWLCCCVVVWCNIVNSNIAYQIMYMTYEQQYYIVSDVLGRIYEIEDVKEQPIVVYCVGAPTANLGASSVGSLVPWIYGVQTSLAGSAFYHMCYNFFGVKIQFLNDTDLRAKIQASEEYQNMPTYPWQGSVRCVDGVVVVRFN